MSRIHVLAPALLFVSLVNLHAQIGAPLSVTVGPNPAPVGTPITVTAEDASGLGLFTPFGCLISQIVSGAPGGPTVAMFPCTFLPGAIPPCGSGSPRTQTWNQTGTGGAQVPPGRYYVEIRHSVGQFGPTNSSWYCLDIVSATDQPAVLSAVNTPTSGSLFQMAIDAPLHPAGSYITALSFRTDSGFAVGTLWSCLDFNDPAFMLSVPVPAPGLLVNFQGALDILGRVSNIGINIPALPAGTCIAMHAQAFVLPTPGSSNGPVMTNDLPFTIQ